MTNWLCSLCDYYGPEKDHTTHLDGVGAIRFNRDTKLGFDPDDWAEMVSATNTKADLKDKIDRDTELGFYTKYHVKRILDPSGKHAHCEYYVLDLTHDMYAKAALEAYANACRNEYPLLAMDLDELS